MQGPVEEWLQCSASGPGGWHRLLIVPPPRLSTLPEQEGLGNAEGPALGRAYRMQAPPKGDHTQSATLQRTLGGQSPFSSTAYDGRGSEFGAWRPGCPSYWFNV